MIVSHFLLLRDQATYKRREEEKEEEEGQEDFKYGLLWVCMDSWILGLVLCLGFFYEKF